MVLINGKIFTAENKYYENGYIRITGERISEIGDMKNYISDLNDKEIDFSNKFIMPGIIDSHCHLGMWEDSVGFESDDGNEDTDPITPHLRACDGVKLFDKCFSEAMESGVTTVFTGPGSSNPAAGLFAAFNTGGKKENMMLKEPICLKIALGENPKSTYHTKNLAPVTRMATISLLREMFYKAKRYLEEIGRASCRERV